MTNSDKNMMYSLSDKSSFCIIAAKINKKKTWYVIIIKKICINYIKVDHTPLNLAGTKIRFNFF